MYALSRCWHGLSTILVWLCIFNWDFGNIANMHNFCFHSGFCLHLRFGIKSTTASSIGQHWSAHEAYVLLPPALHFCVASIFVLCNSPCFTNERVVYCNRSNISIRFVHFVIRMKPSKSDEKLFIQTVNNLNEMISKSHPLFNYVSSSR